MRIRVRNLKNIVLTDESYEKYRHYFTTTPLNFLIKKNVSFSKQPECVHDVLKRIKDSNNYDADFYVAARKFINNEGTASQGNTLINNYDDNFYVAVRKYEGTASQENTIINNYNIKIAISESF
ncbi:hypothetical protein C2G38_2191814 [Gigaspora rosea]|uniref:Uncharacterized protein n=1 Tax=Gigaspora rosea TaxID=44941 RepID=A0A397V2R3_9GLOM|nr:hypothetical protein C2G38_2191814 [Gigaspora rosea]